jgi:hypothetical protein
MLREPDLTGFNARERRIFCLGANWAVGSALEAVCRALRKSASRPEVDQAPASQVLFAVAEGYEQAEPGSFMALPDVPEGFE